MTTKLLKISKRVAIILLIVVSIVGMISCKNKSITGSAQSSEVPDTTGPEIPEPNPEPDNPEEPEQPTFPDNTYYKIYAPSSGEDYPTVSYQDTNSLNQIWKDMISRKGVNDGGRWFVRDGDNGGADVREGNYYYFDKNFDIVYMHQTHNNEYKIKIKEFVGGVIVKYSGGKQELTGKVWTIGGLYKTVLNKETENSEGQQGYTKYENNNLNEFMRSIHRWEEGDLSVILMNTGYDFGNNEYGIDEYYCTVDDNYRKDASYFIGVDPNTYLGTDLNGYWEEKLNVRVNHSWKTSEKFNFKFVVAEPYDWHLQ